MANMNVTNNDLGSVVVENSVTGYDDAVVVVPATTTLLAGTILARDSVSLKLVPFVKGGVTNENGIPKTVLVNDVVNEAGAPADKPVRFPLSGKFVKRRLIIAADGDDSNIDAAVRDQLRDYGCEVVDVTERAILDNQ